MEAEMTASNTQQIGIVILLIMHRCNRYIILLRELLTQFPDHKREHGNHNEEWNYEREYRAKQGELVIAEITPVLVVHDVLSVLVAEIDDRTGQDDRESPD